VREEHVDRDVGWPAGGAPQLRGGVSRDDTPAGDEHAGRAGPQGEIHLEQRGSVDVREEPPVAAAAQNSGVSRPSAMAVEPRNGAVRSIGMRNLMAPRHVRFRDHRSRVSTAVNTALNARKRGSPTVDAR
jgi:hypothetical protein